MLGRQHTDPTAHACFPAICELPELITCPYDFTELFKHILLHVPNVAQLELVTPYFRPCDVRTAVRMLPKLERVYIHGNPESNTIRAFKDTNVKEIVFVAYIRGVRSELACPIH